MVAQFLVIGLPQGLTGVEGKPGPTCSKQLLKAEKKKMREAERSTGIQYRYRKHVPPKQHTKIRYTNKMQNLPKDQLNSLVHLPHRNSTERETNKLLMRIIAIHTRVSVSWLHSSQAGGRERSRARANFAQSV